MYAGVRGCQLNRRSKFGRRDRGRGAAPGAPQSTAGGSHRGGEPTRAGEPGRANESKLVRGIHGAVGHTAPKPRHSSDRGEKRGGTHGAAGGGKRGSGSGDTLAVRPGNVVEGTVSAHRAGYGFLRVEGMADNVFIPPREMRGLMHGDRARVRVSKDASDRWLGEVLEITGRGVNAFLGTVELLGRAAWVTAADRRLQLRCSVAPADINGARNGDWVIARITRHASAKRARSCADPEAARSGPAGGAVHRIRHCAVRVAA